MFFLVACAPPAYEITVERCDQSEESCDAALMADLGVDPDAFAEEDLERLLAGQRELLTWNLGPWPPEVPVEPPFLRMLEPVPGEDARERVYNFVAEQIDQTRPVSDTEFAFRFQRGLLLVRSGPYPHDYASSLLHEAAHSVAPPHTHCPDQPSCDVSPAGAYAMQLAVLTLAQQYENPDLDRLEKTAAWADARLEVP